MTTAGAVAAELRRIADALDKEGDAPMKEPYLYFIPHSKEQFLGLPRLLPKPLYKGGDDFHYELKTYQNWSDSAVYTKAWISRSKVCKLVKPAQPAEYKCEPLLSEDEEAALIPVCQPEPEKWSKP